jgi:hypothetical protein
MGERYRVIGSGEVVEVDHPRRHPRLVRSPSWADLPRDSTRLPLPRTGGSILPSDGPAWGELVADCPCDDCQGQRAAATN